MNIRLAARSRLPSRRSVVVVALLAGVSTAIYLSGADRAGSAKPLGDPRATAEFAKPPPAAADFAKPLGDPLATAEFEQLLERHQDLTYDGLTAHLAVNRTYLEKLSFDPTQAKYFGLIDEKLKLTDAEKRIFGQTGFVSIDLRNRHTFASAYFQIYAQDLPVLVTSDSILHALHRSYAGILIQLELTLFTATIAEILQDCHEMLANAASGGALGAQSCDDVDLYLTVARNLLAGAGAADADEKWSGKLLVGSRRGQDDAALALLKNIQSLRIQTPETSPPTAIYGGTRYMDYSQFRPRGHYTKQTELKRYFRTLMWLGRVDCGWNVLPTDQSPGIVSDSDRELRNAALLVELLRKTDSLKRLASVDDILGFLVGRSDNLSVFALKGLLADHRIETLRDLDAPPALERLKEAIRIGNGAGQKIRSQVIVSDPSDPYVKAAAPATFQIFGQRFVIDSFVLSQVVFDSIVFEHRKQKRMMPAGLDVMAALGNDEAVPLLRDDLTKYNYSANLLASREYLERHPPEFWNANLYNIWLDALRTLDDDQSARRHVPEALRTAPWQMKQLQTQLGSWAELRHDTILYAKQSYTANFACEYPAGYVEPYPEFYSRVRYFAGEAARRFAEASFSTRDVARQAEFRNIQQGVTGFFHRMGETLGRLEQLANKELDAQPFTDEERTFLKKTIDARGGGSGPPRYDGWYGDLFYDRQGCVKWDPTIVDVHTDPTSGTCLEVGIGDVNLGVIAIDNEGDRAVYVGPLFSYYEFRQPVKRRLTDPEWQTMIGAGQLPARPKWIQGFQAPAREPSSAFAPNPRVR